MKIKTLIIGLTVGQGLENQHLKILKNFEENFKLNTVIFSIDDFLKP